MEHAVRVAARIGDRGRPEFLAVSTPALSWSILTTQNDWRQQAYEIEVRRDGSTETFSATSDRAQHVPWPAGPLASYATVEVRVRVQGDDGVWSSPSDWVSARTGPLQQADWHAELIASGAEPADGRRTARFRTVFQAADGLVSAVLSATAHGVHEMVLNGHSVSDEVLAPGWTAYEHRLLFSTTDVTALVRRGDNVLGATVAEGWFRERFGFDGRFAVAYPGPIGLSAQLRLAYRDGTVEEIRTGDGWTATTTGPTLSASIYQGETYDARLEDSAFADPAVLLPESAAAVTVAFDTTRLEPAALPPVRRIERIVARELITTPSGRTVVDFGQNLVGWLELEIDAPAGTELVLRHAEVLEHGELGTRPLRFAAATDRYVSAGRPSTWSPRFTFHGFRYAEVSGWPGTLKPEAVVAVVVHSDLARTGTLETSDPMLNRLHENVVWGMRGNFLSIPSDCPQRDERLGWTGDIQVFAPTASYLYDVSGFLRSWLADLALEQDTNGSVPMVVPSPIAGDPGAAAAWGDAATLVPDTLYTRFGDRAVLEAQYASMRAWVEAERALAGSDHLWAGGFQFGDWLDPSAPPHNPAGAKTDSDIVATAYFFHSTERLAAAAEVLGLEADVVEYRALAVEIRAAFLREYVTATGRMLSDAHTAYALAIAFGLIDEQRRQAAGDRLAELVRAYGYRVRTGFVGTPLIADALTDTGHIETAYRLLLETGNPSWLYPITMGATTIWERWDSMLPDGTINPGEMTSFNHYALGAIADWMQRTIGGIAPSGPGYRSVRVEPRPGGGLTSARATLETGYGTLLVAWRIEGAEFRLDVTVPANSSAEIVLPNAGPILVGSGTHSWSVQMPLAREAHAPFSFDTSLAAFVDDPAARASLEGLFAEVGYFIGLGFTDSGRWRSDTPLKAGLPMFPAERMDRLQALLDELNAATP